MKTVEYVAMCVVLGVLLHFGGVLAKVTAEELPKAFSKDAAWWAKALTYFLMGAAWIALRSGVLSVGEE